MAATYDISMSCLNDLMNKLKTVSLVKDKVISVYTEKEIMDKATQLPPPLIGVVYEGMRAVPDMDKLARGYTVEMMFTVVLVVSGQTFGDSPSSKLVAADVLDKCRAAIKGTQNPYSQWWKFMVEAAVQETTGGFMYMQRWSTRAMLTSNG